MCATSLRTRRPISGRREYWASDFKASLQRAKGSPPCDYTISAKLAAGFGIVIALTAVLGVLSITRMGSLDRDAQQIFKVDLQSILLTSQIEEEGLEVEEHMTKGVLAALMASDIAVEDPVHSAELQEQAEHFLAEAEVEAADVTHKIEELANSGLLNSAELALVAEIDANWHIFLLELEEVQADEEAGLTSPPGRPSSVARARWRSPSSLTSW